MVVVHGPPDTGPLLLGRLVEGSLPHVVAVVDLVGHEVAPRVGKLESELGPPWLVREVLIGVVLLLVLLLPGLGSRCCCRNSFLFNVHIVTDKLIRSRSL